MGSHRQQMHKNAMEAARFGVGISLVPGPPIKADGNCIFKAAISQVIIHFEQPTPCHHSVIPPKSNDVDTYLIIYYLLPHPVRKCSILDHHKDHWPI